MSKIGEMKEDDHLFWIDHNNFIHGDLAYQVESEGRAGRIHGFHYWRSENEIIRATISTEAGVADSRPPATDELAAANAKIEELRRDLDTEISAKWQAQASRDGAKARIAEAEQFARDIAHKLGIDYTPPVSKGECVYLKALEAIKERNAELEARLAEAKETTAASINALQVWIERAEKAEAENARQRAALEQYADMSNWLVSREERTPTWIWLDDDGNAIAQAALRGEAE